MNWFKKKAYTYFAEEERKELEKEAKSNTVGADGNMSSDSTTPELSKKLSPKTKKRLIGWTIFLVIFGTIFGLILYFSLRSTEQNVTRIDTITVKQANKSFDIETNLGKKTVNINPNNLPYSYKLTTVDYKLFIPMENDLPLAIRLSVRYEGSNPFVYIPGTSYGSYATPAGDSLDFYNSAIAPGILSNWTFEPSPINWFSLIISLLPIILFILMFWFAFKMMKMQGGGQDGIFGMGKSGATLAKSTVKFSDVAGIEEEKYELSEIVDYLKSPQKYAAMGARTPKGVILYGPPGTGKTLLAKAVAGEAGVSFFQISGSQFEDMLVGVGAKRVRDLFLKARKAAPAIIFIDEIDSVASKRGKNEFGGGLADQTINQLLAEMDGFNTSTGIVVIAATNRLDVLDDAILRPGRFDRHVQVNLPDIKEREAILKIHSRNKNIAKSVSLYDIARRTPGFSGAQLENVLNEATLLAVREDHTIISTHDIDEAIDRVIAGPAKKSRVITQSERKLIAYHEAGHALIGLYTPGTDVVQKITIIPRGQAAGYTMQTPEGIEKRIQSKEDLLANIRMTLGGRAAEEVIFGADQITTGASNDLYKITNIARAMVMQLGMTKAGLTQFFPSEGSINPYNQQKLYSETKAIDIDKQIELIIQGEYDAAKKLIKTHKKELELIVETLLILETIMKDEIDFIHKHKKLPPAAVEARNKAKKETEKSKSKTTKNKPSKSDNKTKN